MAQTFKRNGLVLPIVTPSVSGVVANSLYRSGGWVGVVQRDITGTSEAEVTIDGRPIINLAGETATMGDGLGDIAVEGVYTVGCSGNTFTDGSPVYFFGQDTQYATPTWVADTPAVGPGTTAQVSGLVSGTSLHSVSGVLLGYAVGPDYTTRDSSEEPDDVYWGAITNRVVDVKLLGYPLTADDLPYA